MTFRSISMAWVGVCLALAQAPAHGAEQLEKSLFLLREDSTRVLQLSSGASIPAPAPDALSCREVQKQLQLLDLSGYRLDSRAPRDKRDMDVFLYEDALSRTMFHRCRDEEAVAEPAEAFSRGFGRY
ncbi:MAG: hypothetical protein AAF074_05105 [Pseudomonadota bacterium]